MATLQEKVDALSRHISELAAQQTHLGQQLLALMNELDELKRQLSAGSAATASTTAATPPVKEKVVEFPTVITAPSSRGNTASQPHASARNPGSAASQKSGSFEEFIGKNLASKVGILITIVGIFIGARYAIEHNLVSPVVRVINGYVSGLALVGIAWRLRKKYETYSSVLMGGGLCVLYFITYIAWSFYGMLPQPLAFGLMVLFTAAIVSVAVLYNRVIIAHLAQVGAYAIPFLLSDNSGRYGILFTYMLIINAGILVLSFYKYWKSLFHVAYFATWIIFAAWFFIDYQERHFNLAAVFLSAFFILFYATFLAYKLIRKKTYTFFDVLLLLTNAFIFYWLGYALLKDYATLDHWAGLFTLVNAGIHWVVSLAVRKRLQVSDKPLYYMIFGLVVVFLTIAVPVQLDGDWVTFLWTAEAVLLFVIGRTRKAPLYEQLGAGLVLLSFISLLQDRIQVSRLVVVGDPFRNIAFYTGLFVAAGLGTITWINSRKQWAVPKAGQTQFHAFYDYFVPVLLILVSFSIPFIELSQYFAQMENNGPWYTDKYPWEEEPHVWGVAMLFLYSLVYGGVVIYANQRWIRSKWLTVFSLAGIAILWAHLLVVALPALNDMAAGYFQYRGGGTYFGLLHLLVRYLILGLVALIVVMGARIVREYVQEPMLKQGWWLMTYAGVLGIISYEYISWTTIAGGREQYRVGLSIIWGLFALALVIYGIWKKEKYIRMAAIVGLVATIGKLFMYDLAEAGTITKTVAFLTLGAILLLVSYLYNRYKEVLFGEEKTGVRP